MSQRAKVALLALVEDLPVSQDKDAVAVSTKGVGPRTWTFAGTRANRTWAHHAAAGGRKVRFDALSVDIPASLISSTAGLHVILTDTEIANFAETIKFSACVPRNLITRTIIARDFSTMP